MYLLKESNVPGKVIVNEEGFIAGKKELRNKSKVVSDVNINNVGLSTNIISTMPPFPTCIHFSVINDTATAMINNTTTGTLTS